MRFAIKIVYTLLQGIVIFMFPRDGEGHSWVIKLKSNFLESCAYDLLICLLSFNGVY